MPLTERNRPQYSGARAQPRDMPQATAMRPRLGTAHVALPTDAGYGMPAAGSRRGCLRRIPSNGGGQRQRLRRPRSRRPDFLQRRRHVRPGLVRGPSGAWAPTGWTAGQAWSAATWPAVGASFGWGGGVQPVYYDYGNNITYQGDQVYYGGQPVATADQYYQQASTLGRERSSPDPNSGEWMPLGVFALVQKDQSDPHYIMQLAVNKSGALAGNYSDLISGTNVPIQGAVDKKTQRVAWTVGDNKQHRGRNRTLQPDQGRVAGADPHRQGQDPAVDAGPAQTTGTGRRREVRLIGAPARRPKRDEPFAALTAVIEAATGLALMAVPTVVVRLLLGGEISGASIPLGRVAGFGLLSLGMACWPGPGPTGNTAPALRAMLTYNALATLYLLCLGIDGNGSGRSCGRRWRCTASCRSCLRVPMETEEHGPPIGGCRVSVPSAQSPVMPMSLTPATRQIASACTRAASAFMTSPAALMISSGVRAFCWASLRTWSISPAVLSDTCACSYSPVGLLGFQAHLFPDLAGLLPGHRFHRLRLADRMDALAARKQRVVHGNPAVADVVLNHVDAVLVDVSAQQEARPADSPPWRHARRHGPSPPSWSAWKTSGLDSRASAIACSADLTHRGQGRRLDQFESGTQGESHKPVQLLLQFGGLARHRLDGLLRLHAGDPGLHAYGARAGPIRSGGGGRRLRPGKDPVGRQQPEVELLHAAGNGAVRLPRPGTGRSAGRPRPQWLPGGLSAAR